MARNELTFHICTIRKNNKTRLEISEKYKSYSIWLNEKRKIVVAKNLMFNEAPTKNENQSLNFITVLQITNQKATKI